MRSIRALAGALLFLWTAAVFAAPISTYPAATSPLSGAEQIVATQASKTVNVTPAQLATYATSGNPYVTLEQYGCAGDATFNSSYVLTDTPTDNLPCLNAILAQASAGPQGNANDKVATTILLNPKGAYWFSALPEFHTKINITGSASTQDNGFITGSAILFPRSTGGPIFQDNGTTGRAGTSITPLGSSRGSVVSGVNFVGIGSGSDPTAHGFQMRAPMALKNSKFFNVAGSCVYIVGYTDGGSPAGEVNGFELDAYGHDCGVNGLEVGGSDVNAAKPIQFAVHQAAQVGIKSYSYFANKFLLGDISGYGNTGVYYSGVDYVLHSNQGDGGSTTPGTNNTIWWPIASATGASSSFPLWVSGHTYNLQLPIWDSGGGSVYTAPYIESSVIGAWINPGSILVGGTATNTSFGGIAARAPYGEIVSSSGMGGYQTLTSNANFGYPYIGGMSGEEAYSLVGTIDNGTGQLVNRAYFNARATESAAYTEEFNNVGDNVLRYGQPGGGGRELYWHTTSNDGIGVLSTAAKMGRFSMVGVTAAFPGLALGGDLSIQPGGTSGYASPHRLFQMQASAPTSGQFAQGEHIFNYAPSPGGVDAWIATTTGAIATSAWTANTVYNVGALVTNDSGKSYVSIAPPAWAAAHVYSAGALITGQDSTRFITAAGGTSAATGLGPLANFGSLVDGTVTWVATPLGTTVSASSGGPTGTGTAILDKQVEWTYAPPFVLTPSQIGALSSVGSTPVAVGFQAVVGSAPYIATGISSSADWKQIVIGGAYTASSLTMTTARLLGRTTASTGAAEEISIGTGLSLSAGTLNLATVQTILSGTTGSIGGGALTAGTCATGTVSVTGAATTMAVEASPQTYPGDAFTWSGYVSSANTVTVRVCTNLAAGGTPSASLYNVRVLQ